ncbi:MAG TPA: hypothetical protein VFS58_06750 [Steroidobacteraceae bacterium]|nr:hypothetical protein [Steroidobacteraceae bacterium]
MDRRIVLAIAGMAAVATVVWLTTRIDKPDSAAEPALSSTMVSVTPEPTSAPATVGSSTMSTAPRPTVPASGLGATSPTQSMGEVLPIDVSPGFEYLRTPAAEMKDTDARWTKWNQHQKLQSEPRDEAWASRIEVELRNGIQNRLTAAGYDSQRIELPVVACRTTGCEIQAVGYGEDATNSNADFRSLLRATLGGPLGGEFEMGKLAVNMKPSPDGRIQFFVILPRKEH